MKFEPLTALSWIGPVSSSIWLLDGLLRSKREMEVVPEIWYMLQVLSDRYMSAAFGLEIALSSIAGLLVAGPGRQDGCVSAQC